MMKTLCFIFLCSLTAVNAATVNIGAFGVTSTTPATKTYVGPLKLVDDPALGFTLDINGTYGTGANEIGFKVQVGGKTNDNPGKYLLYIYIIYTCNICVVELYRRRSCNFSAFHLSIALQ